MIRTDQTVVRSDFMTMPVAPTTHRGTGLRKAHEFVWPREQPVALTHRVVRDRIAPDISLVRLSLQKRTAAKKTSLAITPRAREYDLRFRRGQDRFEVAAISCAGRQRIEFCDRDDMI